MKLLNYWRSGTSYRVRLALSLKGLSYDYVPVDLRQKEHKSEDYLSLNPQGLVPTLTLDDGTRISQSPAIIEYFEEAYPNSPSLFPEDIHDRARARAIAAIIGCDVHPLNNLRILNHLKNDLSQEADAVSAWIEKWIIEGFSALETMLKADTHRREFCINNMPGIVECYLLPQIYSAQRFNVNLEAFPTINEIEKRCKHHDFYREAYPDYQPDAD